MSRAPIAIRREHPDQPDVQSLLAALDGYLASLYPPEANHILTLDALLAPDVRFFVARDGDGRAVGTAAARLVADDGGDGRYGEVKRMWVAPAARGKGVAAALLAAVEDAIRTESLPLARLETGRDQREAVRLYERHGYARCAPFGGYPDNGLSLFFEKALPA